MIDDKIKNRLLNGKKLDFSYSIIIKVFISLIAISDQSLTVLTKWWYTVNVPIIKSLFAIFEPVSDRGIVPIIMALALGGVYYAVKDRQKNPWLSVFSVFLSVTTVFGKSYLELGNWDYIFFRKLQLLLAMFVMAGYYFIYKNSMLFLILIFERHKEKILRKILRGKIEKFLFEKRTFLKSFVIILILGLPYLICFFPGTMQWDAWAQLCEYFGISAMSGQQPVAVTNLMGICMVLGRNLFHSDNIGMFLYTGPQFLFQSAVFAYTIFVLCKINSPVLVRWGTLILFSIYPIFPIWGYTLVKDTGYYIFTLLFLTVMLDVLCSDKKPLWWQIALFLIGTAGVGIFRNNGRYVIFLALLYAGVAYKKYWKLFLSGLTFCFMILFMIERVYMPLNEIPSGPVYEMLSIPLQQTARYVREHADEITPQERTALESVFVIDIDRIGQYYAPEISDPVKGNFVPHPTSEQLKDYFIVWFQQFLKHPDTYIQAFLNHTYGYFYPDRDNFWDRWGVYSIGNSDHWQDGNLDLSFAIENSTGRDFLRESASLAYNMPVIGMLYSCGFLTYILLGFTLHLIMVKKWRALTILIPSLCMLLICIASPVDAYFRYMLPIVVAFPIDAAWCCHVGQKRNGS